MHIHIILYTQRAACLVLFAVCQRSSFAVSRSEHKNASGDLTPVASRKRVQRYGVFIYRPNLSATFLKVFWKKKKTGRKTEVLRFAEIKKWKMRLSECRSQTCLNYVEREHLRRSQQWINEKWKAAHQLSTHSFFHLAILTPHIVGTLDFSLFTYHFSLRLQASS